MSIEQIYQQFIDGMKQTTWLEYIAVLSGIIGVWYLWMDNMGKEKGDNHLNYRL